MKELVWLLSGLVLVAGAIPVAQAQLTDPQAPDGGIAAGSAPDSCSEPPAGTTSQGPVAGMLFAWIPSGEFMMGSPLTEQDRESWEGPQHELAVDSFELLTTEVTQGMWREVMGTTVKTQQELSGYDYGFYGLGDDHPMYYVSWDDCQAFIQVLNEIDPDHLYRLPSEAEWEYACRAGSTTRFYWGDDQGYTRTGEYAWYYWSSLYETHPAGRLHPNSWGLYDMAGNVCEWCQDCFCASYDGAPADGSSRLDGGGSYRVLRGGYWEDDGSRCRSAYRDWGEIDCRSSFAGFRVARTAR